MRVSIPRALLVALAVTVAGAFIVAGATSGVAFGLFNPTWEGTSELRTVVEESGSEPTVIRNASEYERYGENDTVFVLAPERSYDDRDVEQIRAFLERGGTLVVADRDGPHGHELLAGLGAEARPDGALLRDDRHHHRSPALPVANNVSDEPLVEGVDSVTLNYGTAVEPNGATVLVSTSSFAYLDRDGSGTLSANETVASYPVATAEPVGNGTVVTVGDPSVFINVMAEEQNRAFVVALIDGAERTGVDVSHGSSPPPLVSALLSIRDSVALQFVLGAGALGIVAAIARRHDRRG